MTNEHEVKAIHSINNSSLDETSQSESIRDDSIIYHCRDTDIKLTKDTKVVIRKLTQKDINDKGLISCPNVTCSPDMWSKVVESLNGMEGHLIPGRCSPTKYIWEKLVPNKIKAYFYYHEESYGLNTKGEGLYLERQYEEVYEDGQYVKHDPSRFSIVIAELSDCTAKMTSSGKIQIHAKYKYGNEELCKTYEYEDDVYGNRYRKEVTKKCVVYYYTTGQFTLNFPVDYIKVMDGIDSIISEINEPIKSIFGKEKQYKPKKFEQKLIDTITYYKPRIQSFKKELINYNKYLHECEALLEKDVLDIDGQLFIEGACGFDDFEQKKSEIEDLLKALQ